MLVDAPFNARTSDVIGAAIEVHRTLGLEVKAVAALVPVHQAQILTYMSLTGCPAGLLINFNTAKLVDGVKRLINPRADKARR